MQLQALIDSIEIHTKGVFNKISVIYKADDEHKAGYDLFSKRKPAIEMIEQGDFKTDLLSLFEYEYTCFAADDDIVYRDFNKALLQEIKSDVSCFSLRLGLNVDYCYSNNLPNKIGKYEQNGDFITWNWREQSLDFGYPLSVVSHVFRTNDIEALSRLEEYTDPNTYEMKLQKHLDKLPDKIVSYKESRIFGVPANRVNTTTNNRNGLTYAYSTEDLLSRYLQGYIIDISSMNYVINAAQQEIEYKFKNYG